MVIYVRWQNNLKKIIEWKCFLTIVSLVYWTTFLGKNNQKLIMGGILIKILVTWNNILV
jgi:hypothetical protein